jgi:hypothetical protein
MKLIKELTNNKEKILEIKSSQDDTLRDVIDKYMEFNRFYHFDGPRGVRNFKTFISDLNPEYRDLEYFLEDNPGAINAIIEWISDTNLHEWKENLKSCIPEYNEDEEE